MLHYDQNEIDRILKIPHRKVSLCSVLAMLLRKAMNFWNGNASEGSTRAHRDRDSGN